MSRALLLCAAACLLAADTPKEEGFVPLFNGKDLTGWKTQAKKKGTTAESLDGKSEAYKGRFKVNDELLVIDPKVGGDVRIETAKAYGGDTVIRFEYKPGPKCNNDLFFRGHKYDILLPKGKAEEGKWYKFEIAVKGDMIEFSQDGKSVRKGAVKGKGATPFEIRAEHGEIEFRNMRIKE